MSDLPRNYNDFKNQDNQDNQESRYVDIIEQLKKVDTSKMPDDGDIDEDNRGFDLKITKGKEYSWSRVFTKEDVDGLERGDDITFTYVPTGETLTVPFGSYDKVGLANSKDEDVTNYVSDDDKKVLCLLIDIDKINNNSSDIPNIRKNFRFSRHYYEDLFLKTDLVLTIDKTGEKIDYFRISF